jgi:amphi-Trp domain-containing protein
MKQKTGFQAWFDASRDDVARVFTNLGEGLEDGNLNWEAISIDVPESVEVEIECGAEDDDGDEYEFEFTMSWDASEVAEEPATNGTAERADDEGTAAVEDGGPGQRATPDAATDPGPEEDKEGPSRPAPDEPGEGNHPADRSF